MNRLIRVPIVLKIRLLGYVNVNFIIIIWKRGVFNDNYTSRRIVIIYVIANVQIRKKSGEISGNYLTIFGFLPYNVKTL